LVKKPIKFMKLSLPVLLAIILLLAAMSFVHADVASAAGQLAPIAENAAATLTSTITATSVITPIDLAGVIFNGSGIELPEALPVTLYAYQPGQAAMDLVLTNTTTTGPGGAFTFEDVENPEGSVFMTSVTYAGVPYHSTPSMGEPMTITVYETATTTDHLLADQLHLIFSISEAGYLQVMEVYILTNVGDQTIVAGEDGQFMVDFPLPDGAQNPDFRSGLVGEAELETNDGFWEIPAVRPGGLYGVSYTFSMPYSGKITVNQPIELPVSSVGALLPAVGTLKIESAALLDGGLSDFGGVSYHVYTGESLRAGSQLAVNITGNPNATASEATTGSSESQLGLIIGVGAFGLALILAGVWLSRRTRLAATQLDVEMGEGEESSQEEEATDTPEDAEALMDDIIALDDLYQAGELPEAAYRERRDELKEKLRTVVGDEE
jgi:hypothetical protein